MSNFDSLNEISWIGAVEKELSINNIEFSQKDKNIIEEDIIKDDPSNLTNLEIIEKQIMVIKNMLSIIKLQDVNILYNNNNDFINNLEWLTTSSNIISKKMKLTPVQHKTVPNILSRSSYKFCTNNFKCKYNYNIKKTNGCYAHHYVHNLLYADLISVKQFLFDIKELKENTLKEIKKSLITISYVIHHMHDELLQYKEHIKI